MAKAEIISEIGSGQYQIKRIWAGRSEIEDQITLLNAILTDLQKQHEIMPETTDDELFKKHIVAVKISSIQKKINYLTNEFPDDETVTAWCADLTEGLTGEVGTIDIAGEYTMDVSIRPASLASNAYSAARDGELYPAIALGPWTCLLNQMIYPGWQRFKPLHRYAVILEDTIDYNANTCAVAVQPTFSLMNYYVNKAATGGGEAPAAGAGVRSARIKNYNVNYGDVLGQDEIILLRAGILEQAAAREFFIQNSATAHPGFLDFVDRYPDHPISNVTGLNPPLYITDEQYIQLQRICTKIDYFFRYKSDQSGYEISDYWDVMYDLGDPWYWTPTYSGEAQQEFTFGNVNLLYDNSGLVVGIPDATIDEYYKFGTYTARNLELEFAARQYAIIGPRPKRAGDCEDFVLTKMQAIIEAGIIPAGNLQVLLCYVVNAGYHAVLGIQTANRGFLISDQRDYGQLWEIEQLSRTHIWESFSVATAAGEASETVKWAKTQLILKDVPIEYMGCNAEAFAGGEEVIVEFTDQSWASPKVIGFKESPQLCSSVYVFPGHQTRYESASRTMRLDYTSESWSWKPKFPGYDTRVAYAATGEGGLGFTVCGSGERDVAFLPMYNDLDIFDSATETFSAGTGHPEFKADLGFRSLKNGKCITSGGGYWSRTGSIAWYPGAWWGLGDYDYAGTIPQSVFNSTHEYLIAGDSWTTKAQGKNVYDHADFVIDEILFSIGGTQLTVFPAVKADSRMAAYENVFDKWWLRQTCPQSGFRKVHGYNLDGKGIVGGGALIDNQYKPGGIETVGETYLYDNPSDAWTVKNVGPVSYGDQAASEGLNESIALRFGGQAGGTILNWYSFKLSTDTWENKGKFGIKVSEDPEWYSNRQYCAGTEL